MATFSRPAHKFLPPPRDKRPESSGFRFPGASDRVTINGMTGSGKSTFAMWLFSESADFDKKPWFILDFKGEILIQQALREGLFTELSISARIPDKPGVYVVRHEAREGLGPVTEFLWSIYQAGKRGLFLDEATMIPELRGEANSGGPFQSILSQGRSKEIPVYVLAQRPVNVNNMVFTENNFYCAFRLRSKRDLQKVTDHIPEDSKRFDQIWGDNLRLPAHYSRWYDAQQDASFLLKPCPPPDRILDALFARIDSAKKREKL